MHIYECEDGTKVPSVTTILQILGSKEINLWANSLGFRHIKYEEKLNQLAEDGTKMHSVVQHIVDPSLEDEVRFNDPLEKEKYKKIGKRFEHMISIYNYDTKFTEKTFVSKELGYGGTIDWVANINGFNMLNDFKSSKQVYLKHLLQLGGYYNLLKENNFTIDGASIILVNTKICAMFPISKADLEYFADLFNDLAKFYKGSPDDITKYYNKELNSKLIST